MFARIGDVLPRFRTYERLFSNHEHLIQALSVAYFDIIGFCSDAKSVFRRGQRLSSKSLSILHLTVDQRAKHDERDTCCYLHFYMGGCDLTHKGALYSTSLLIMVADSWCYRNNSKDDTKAVVEVF